MLLATTLISILLMPKFEDFPKYRMEENKPFGYEVKMEIEGKSEVSIAGQFAVVPIKWRTRDWDLNLVYQSDLKLGNQKESKRYTLNLITDERLWPTAIAGGELLFVEQFLACLMLPTGPSQTVTNGTNKTARTSSMKVEGDLISLTTHIESPDQKSDVVQVYSSKLGHLVRAKSNVNLKGTVYRTELTELKE